MNQSRRDGVIEIVDRGRRRPVQNEIEMELFELSDDLLILLARGLELVLEEVNAIEKGERLSFTNAEIHYDHSHIVAQTLELSYHWQDPDSGEKVSKPVFEVDLLTGKVDYSVDGDGYENALFSIRNGERTALFGPAREVLIRMVERIPRLAHSARALSSN